MSEPTQAEVEKCGVVGGFIITGDLLPCTLEADHEGPHSWDRTDSLMVWRSNINATQPERLNTMQQIKKEL